MKRILFLALLFVTLTSQAQIPGATTVNSRYEWLGGAWKTAIMPTYADTSQYPTNWLPKKAGHFMLDSAGADKGTFYLKYDGYWHPAVGQGITNIVGEDGITITQDGDTLRIGYPGGSGGSDTSVTYLEAGDGIIFAQNGDTVRISIDPAFVGGSSTNRIGGGVTATDFSLVDDGDWYQGFPTPTVIGDTIYATFKRGFEHVAEGWIPFYRSYDGGLSWDSINTLVPRGYGSASLVTAVNDTLFFSYDKPNVSDKIYFAYSSNFGKTIITTDSLSIASWNIISYGKFIRMPSGRMFLAAYLYKTGNYSIRLLSSPNGRTGWASYSTIKEAVNTTMNLNETWIEKIEDGATTDATTKLITICRDELLNGYVQFTSSNGGSTWTERGRVTSLLSSGDEMYGAPCEVKQYGGNLFLFAARRVNRPGASTVPDLHLAYSSGAVDSVFTTPAKWSKAHRVYNSEINTGGGIVIDFGYFVSYVLNGSLRLMGYDVSPNNVYLDDTTRTQIITIPVFDLNLTEVYATGNQNTTANTEAKIILPYTNYDTELAFDSVNSVIRVVKPGIYYIKGIVTFMPDASGSYRKAYIKASNTNSSAGARNLVEKTISPSESVDFNRMEIETTTYLHAGEKIGLYIYGDAAGEIRNSSEVSNRASLKMKLIRK